MVQWWFKTYLDFRYYLVPLTAVVVVVIYNNLLKFCANKNSFHAGFLNISPHSYREKQDLLHRLAVLQHTLMQGIPVITRFLAQYLPLWNERDYFAEVIFYINYSFCTIFRENRGGFSLYNVSMSKLIYWDFDRQNEKGGFWYWLHKFWI